MTSNQSKICFNYIYYLIKKVWNVFQMKEKKHEYLVKECFQRDRVFPRGWESLTKVHCCGWCTQERLLWSHGQLHVCNEVLFTCVIYMRAALVKHHNFPCKYRNTEWASGWGHWRHCSPWVRDVPPMAWEAVKGHMMLWPPLVVIITEVKVACTKPTHITVYKYIP